MPDGDRVGSAYVDIHVNAGPGEAELAAFKAKVDRDFDELGRKKAEASLSLKKLDFDKNIDEAKAQLDYFKKRRAEATLDLAKKHFDEQVAAAEAELKALTSKKRTIQLDSRQVQEAHKQERLLAKEHQLTERSALQSAKAERALSNEREKAVTRTFKERAELAKLGQEYEKLRGRQIGLEKSSRRVFSSKSIGTADKEARRLEKVASEADYVKHKIENLGGSVEDLDPQIQKNHTLWGRWLSRLGDTSVRIGPITTSVKGLGTGLGLLGPLVFELGGGLTALAGTVGEGLAGAFTVGAGAVAGFALSAAGVGFIIKPMISEFKEVHSATTALSKAQLKYGKDSTQAKTAQEQLNHELHGVSPIAKEGIEAWGGLSSKWKELTKAAKPAVFNAFGQSLKTAQDLLPAFASESVKTTQVASKAWRGWMKSLRSNEAKGLMKNIMGDFRSSIPGLADGLGSLVAMMGRLAAAGAHFLPGLSNGFADWANNLERSVGGGKQLQSDVGGMVDQMRDLGHLTQDTGSLLVHIFAAGSGAGPGRVKYLDQVIKRWDTWTQSAKGKSGLNEFFDESKGATEDFMSSLGHLTKLLFEFSRATAPVANGLLQIVTWIGDLVSAADNLVGVKTIFQGLGFVLAGLFVAGKAMAFASSIQGVTSALYGLAAGEEAVAAAQASGGLGGLLLGKGKGGAVATLGEDAAASAGQLELLGGEAATAGGMMGGAEASAGLLAAALAPEVLVPAAAIGGLVALGVALQDDKRTLGDVRKEFRQGGHEIAAAMDDSSAHVDKYVAAQHHAVEANHSAAAARKNLVKLQHENAGADKITAAVEDLAAAEHHQAAISQQSSRVNKQQITDQEHIVSGTKKRIAAGKELIKDLEVNVRNEREAQEALAGGGDLVAEEKQLAKARHNLSAATKELSQVQKQEAVTAIPYQRQVKELAPISQAAEQGLRKLVNTIGISATKKVGSFVDPKDVQRVTELGNKLTNLGRGQEVKKVAVSSQGADQTINKLHQLQKQTNKVEGTRATIKVGANDAQAQSKLKRLGALSQQVTGSKNTIRILANSSSADNAINRLRHNLETVAHKKYNAELSATDRTTPASASAYHHLREVAAKKYEARIDAVDNASSVAKKAGAAADSAGRKKPKIDITASNSQALGAISAVQTQLASLHDKSVTVTTNYVTHGHPPSPYSGGPRAAYPSFAHGGISDKELQRAYDRAQPAPSGPSRKVSRPTMLVGEQAPNHPEYVIATNPAFRASNEQYLEDAAGDLGKEVVPAYGKGKGKKKGKSASASGNQKHTPQGHPKPQHKGHYYLKHNKFSSQATEEYNTTEKDIGFKENLYNKEVEREEKEIEHGQLEEWNWPQLRGYLTDERNDYRHLGGLTNQIRNDTGKAIKDASKRIKAVNGPIKSTRSNVSKLSGEYSALQAPTKGQKSDAEYTAAKQHYNESKRNKKAEVKAAERHLKKLETEKENALTIKREATEKLNEIGRQKGSIFEKENDIKEEESQTDLSYFEGELKDRTAADASGESKEERTPGEQTASLNEAREKVFNEYGSNVFGYGGAQAGTRAPITNPESYGSGGPNYAATQAATVGAGGYVTQATGGLPTNAVSSGGKGGAGSVGNVNHITNNFAAPPPDAHTWTKQQQFELAAVAS